MNAASEIKMSTEALSVIAAFNALPDAEREAVFGELLVQSPSIDGEMTDESFNELADDIFLMFDEAETTDASSR